MRIANGITSKTSSNHMSRTVRDGTLDEVKLLFTEGVNSIVDLNSTSVVELKERVELRGVYQACLIDLFAVFPLLRFSQASRRPRLAHGSWTIHLPACRFLGLTPPRLVVTLLPSLDW